MYRGLLARMGKSKIHQSGSPKAEVVQKNDNGEESNETRTNFSATSSTSVEKSNTNSSVSSTNEKEVTFGGKSHDIVPPKSLIDSGKSFKAKGKLSEENSTTASESSTKPFYGFPNSKIFGKRRTKIEFPSFSQVLQSPQETKVQMKTDSVVGNSSPNDSRPPKRASDGKPKRNLSDDQSTEDISKNDPVGLTQSSREVSKDPTFSQCIVLERECKSTSILTNTSSKNVPCLLLESQVEFLTTANVPSTSSTYIVEPFPPTNLSTLSGDFNIPPPNIPTVDELIKSGFNIPPPAIPPFKKKRVYNSFHRIENTQFDVTDKNATSTEKIQDKITPLWKTGYERQLKVKEDQVLTTMQKIKEQLIAVNRSCSTWFQFQELQFPSICKLMPMAPAPITEGYLNKCEFIIGVNKDNNELTIGYQIEFDTFYVAPIDTLKNVPPQVKYVTKSLEKYLRSSPISPYNPKTKAGNWMNCSVRLTVIGNVMVIISVNPQGLEEFQVKEIKNKLKSHFEIGEGMGGNVTSVYFSQRTLEISGKFELIFGEAMIKEELLGKSFQLFPETIFPLNTSANEILFRILADVTKLDLETTVIDICCGIGTVGLALAHRCGQVLGLDIIEASVNEARNNALINNITNAEIFSGSAEDYLPNLFGRANFSNVVCIVDPPKIGLESRAMINLRRNERISRIVWLITDTQYIYKNIVDLGRPTSNQYKGDPFIPVEVIPIDSFPHTFRFTMIVILMRISQNELSNPDKVHFDKFYNHALKPSKPNTAFPVSFPSTPPPPPDLSWKKVRTISEEKDLTTEQVAWLNQMNETFKDGFDRKTWVETFKKQNLEASEQFPPVPPIVSNSTQPSVDPSNYWSQYSKQYRNYMQHQPSNNTFLPVTQGCDANDWKTYCEKMANYWSQWASSSLSTSTSPFQPPLPPDPPPSTTSNTSKTSGY